jgi:hypothetical protein
MRRPLGLAVLALLAGAAPASAVDGVDTRALTPAARGLGDADAVAAVDLDADGRQDLVLGPREERATGRECIPPPPPSSPYEDPHAFQEVVHVRLRGRTVRLACPAVPLPRDDGPDADFGWSSGGSVTAVGDVDGDGIEDLAVGSAAAGPRGRPSAGSVYLVLGERGFAGADLQAPGAPVVRIDGAGRASGLGRAVVPVGDVNGDGRADVAMTYEIGVAGADGRRLGQGRQRVAIVFGGLAAGSRVDLRAPGAAAIVVAGFPQDEWLSDPPVPVAPAGDLDRDGRDDVALAVSAGSRRDDVVVLAGRTAGGVVDVRRERPLLRVRGAPFEAFGATLATAGDLDGDGRPELAVGTAYAPGVFSIPDVRGIVTVVPGRPGEVDLAHPPRDVRRIVGALDSNAGFGSVLAPAGDLTGDGLPDLLAGAPDTSPGCAIGAGAAWVLPGRPGGGLERVEAVRGVWRVDGSVPRAGLGTDVAVGDADGDGRPELLLPALPFGNAGGRDLLLVDPAARRTRRPRTDVDRCLRAVVEARSRESLRLRVTSSLGAGRHHTVAVSVRAGATRATAERGPAVRRTLRLDGPGTRRLTVPLSRRPRPPAYAEIELEQALSAEVTGRNIERVVRVPG